MVGPFFFSLPLKAVGSCDFSSRQHGGSLRYVTRQLLAASGLYHIKDFILLQLHSPVQVFLDVEGVFLIKVSCVFEVRVLGQVIFIREERPDAPELQNTLASVHDGQFIPAHQLTATLSSDEFRFHIFSADHTSSAAQHLPLSVCTPIHAHAHANLCEIP